MGYRSSHHVGRERCVAYEAAVYFENVHAIDSVQADLLVGLRIQRIRCSDFHAGVSTQE